MRICLEGITEDLLAGIQILARHLGVELSAEGMAVRLDRREEDRIEIIKRGDEAVIRFKQNIHFFRGFGLLVEALGKENEFHIVEEPQFNTIGAMIDVSQGNSVIQVSHVKKLLTYMSVMGLNMLMIYSEDSYEMDNEPYFGYMRSKYSFKELKEIDDFAFSLGIEMIPCIQTLAHLVDALKWSAYSEIRQDLDILLVGNEKTYAFIEKLIDTAAAPFRSRRIHLGMDEAWNLGKGKYLDEHGYRDRFDIMTEHLRRVVEIAGKKGLQPMIWSDMYFKHSFEEGYMEQKADIHEYMPEGVRYIYWDYYPTSESFYTENLAKHQKFTEQPIFAGGILSWSGYGVNYDRTFRSTNAALAACKNQGIEDVFVTIWGDDTVESIIYSNLLGLQLYAEHGYSRELDLHKLKSRFEFCNQVRYDDFLDMTQLEVFPEAPLEYVVKSDDYPPNLSKYLMWQDILLGLFDKNIEGLALNEHFGKLAVRMSDHAKRNGAFNFLFAYYEKVCSVLAIKAELGLNVTNAYLNNDSAVLTYIAEEELPELARRVVALKDCHRSLWMEINKPMGWEVLDLRYGAVFMRIDTVRMRILDYLAGRIGQIEELEQERQYYKGEQGLVLDYVYNTMPTASRISMTTFYTPWE